MLASPANVRQKVRVAAFALLAAATLSAQEPIAGPFPIHEFSSGTQTDASIALQPGRRFVVVWQSEGADGSDEGVRMRLFAGLGLPLTPELPVSQTTEGVQLQPRVAADAAGDFVVVWWGQSTDGTEIFARHFAADGTPLGDEFVVNSETAGYQSHPDVNRNAAGRFVVAWYDDHDIRATVLDPPSKPVVAELTVNDSGEHPANSQTEAAIRTDGAFMVAWATQYPDERHVYQRLYAPNGQALSGERRVSQPDPKGTHPSDDPALAVDDGNAFRVVWERSLNLQDDGVYSRRTDAEGNVGPVQALVEPTLGALFSETPSGEFVVIHAGFYELNGRRFDAAGNPVTDFPVPTESALTLAHLSVDSREFVLIEVVGDYFERDLYGWIFGVVPLFADGFESGDTSAWDEVITESETALARD